MPFPVHGAIPISFEQLYEVIAKPEAERMLDLPIDIFEVGDCIAFVELPGGSVITDEVDMVEGEVRIEDEAEVDGDEGETVEVVF